MHKPDFKSALRESLDEFKQLMIKHTPDFMSKIYQNKPLFWLFIIFAITLEIVIGFWIYGQWLTPRSEIRT